MFSIFDTIRQQMQGKAPSSIVQQIPARPPMAAPPRTTVIQRPQFIQPPPQIEFNPQDFMVSQDNGLNVTNRGSVQKITMPDFREHRTLPFR